MPLLLRINLLCFGTLSIAIGAALLISSNLGSDPYSVLMQGIANQTVLSIGQSNMAMSALYALIILFWDRKLLRMGTLCAIAALGPTIDFILLVLSSWMLGEHTMHLRLMYVVAGCVCLGFGVSSIYQAKLGFLPNDILPLLISKKINKPFKRVRISYDLTTVFLGFLLGGIVGIGTVLCALLTGPLIVFFNNRYQQK